MALEKRKGENDEQFQALYLYCLFGKNRSYRKVAKTTGRAQSTIQRWADKHEWKERAAEYDKNGEKAASSETIRLDENETENVLTILLNILYRKIADESAEIEQMETAPMAKTISVLTKSISEIRKELGAGDSEERIERSLKIAETIRNDDEALNLAVKLLRRLSEIDGNK